MLILWCIWAGRLCFDVCRSHSRDVKNKWRVRVWLPEQQGEVFVCQSQFETRWFPKKQTLLNIYIRKEREAKFKLIRAMLSYNWNSCEQSLKKKYSINGQSPFLQQTPLRTDKLYVVFNFLVLAALMKPVTHLTAKERIYNPPVQMRHLNLSSNSPIFSTELKRRTEVSFFQSLSSTNLAFSPSFYLSAQAWHLLNQWENCRWQKSTQLWQTAFLHLQLQLGVVSQVDLQAVEGSQALRVGITAGTPWARVAHKKWLWYYDACGRMGESGHLKHTHLEGASDCRICSRNSGSTSAMWILPLVRSSTPQTDSSSVCSTTMLAGWERRSNSASAPSGLAVSSLGRTLAQFVKIPKVSPPPP